MPVKLAKISWEKNDHISAFDLQFNCWKFCLSITDMCNNAVNKLKQARCILCNTALSLANYLSHLKDYCHYHFKCLVPDFITILIIERNLEAEISWLLATVHTLHYNLLASFL